MYGSYNWFGSTICFIAAVYFGFQFWTHKIEADRAAQWDRVTGTMETVTISQYNGRRATHTYTPHVLYNFKVKGTLYRGDVISFPSPTFSTPTESKQFQSKYPEGGLVSVYYNAADPNKNCLIPGNNSPLNHEAWTAIGLLALAVILPMIPPRSYLGGGGMYNNPTNMITPSR